jgi:hypothetical protein
MPQQRWVGISSLTVWQAFPGAAFQAQFVCSVGQRWGVAGAGRWAACLRTCLKRRACTSDAVTLGPCGDSAPGLQSSARNLSCASLCRHVRVQTVAVDVSLRLHRLHLRHTCSSCLLRTVGGFTNGRVSLLAPNPL